MAWRLSGNPLPVFMGWERKALMLRTIVLSIPALQRLSDAGNEHMSAMRAFRRGTITLSQLQARIAALPKEPPPSMLHEPLDFHGWTVDATLIDYEGKAWWLVKVTRRTRTVSEGDKRWLFKVLGVLGCDPERDQVSVGDLEENVAHDVPYIYMWPNMFERLSINVPINQSDEMEIVPRGSRPSPGFQSLFEDE